MSISTKNIAVTLCCSDEDLVRVRPLADTLQSEALDVHVCAGVDLDARSLERHMAEPRSPGVFVLCESLDLDAYQLPELETRFERHRGEHDQLVRVNLEKDGSEAILESIRATVSRLAGEEQTLTASLKTEAQSEEVAEALALAKALREANAAKRQAEPEPEPDPDPKPDPEPAPEPEPRLADAGQRRFPVWIVAVLVLLVGAGLAWYAWGSGMFGQGGPAPDEASAAAPADAPSADAPAAAPEPPEDPPAAAEPQILDDEPGEPPPSTDGEATPDEPPAAEVEEEPPTADDTLAGAEAPKLGEIRELDGLLVAPVSDAVFTWRDASNHCRLNKRGGKGSWRLTSIKQLDQLRAAGMLSPGTYWSTTLAVVGGTENLVVDTTEPGSRAASKTEFQARAQCVRAR